MARILSFLFLILLGIGCGSSKYNSSKHHPLNGTWIPVQQEIGGTALPNAAFAKQQLIISDSNYTFTAESVDKGVIQFTGGNMDIYGKEGVNTGKHFTAIYKLQNGELSICYNLKGNGYPNSFITKGNPLYFLCVFKKQ